MVYKRDFSHPNILIQEAILSLNEYKDANVKEEKPILQLTNTVVLVMRHPPSLGMYKVNWDVAINSSNRHMGLPSLLEIMWVW